MAETTATAAEPTGKRPGRAKKIVLGIVIALVVLVAAAAIAVFALFGHELTTLGSIQKVDDYPLYTMTYDGDYGMDEFLEQGGASNDSELIEFVIQRIMKGLPITIDLPDLACSTFNATTPEGDALFGRNFDLEYSPGMLVRTTPEDGYASVSMVNLGFLGYGEDKMPDDLVSSLTALAAPYAPLDGMNEAGLGVGVLLIDTDPTDQQTDKVDITTTTAIRLMLDTCATVDEAVALLERYDMHSSANSCYHFQIADASGDSAVVEYIGNEMSVLDPGDATTMGELSGSVGVAYQVATNFLLTPGEYDFGGGQDRYKVLMGTLAEHEGVLTKDEAMGLLQSVSRAVQIRDDGSVFQTQWSCVYNLDDLRASIIMGGKYDEPAYEVSLAE